MVSDNKMIISPKKYRGETSVVSVRLPGDLIKRIDDVAAKTGRTRNEIIQKCLVYSVDNLEIKEY